MGTGVGTSRQRPGMPPALRPRRLGSVQVRGHVAIEPPTGGGPMDRDSGPAPGGDDTRPDFITLRDQLFGALAAPDPIWTLAAASVVGDGCAQMGTFCTRRSGSAAPVA